MPVSNSSIHALVQEIKKEMFIDIKIDDLYSFVSPSAYDTAWLAMVPDSNQPCQPMFKDCLNWVLNNQREEGFWGECDVHGRPTIESLPSTLACLIVLIKWNSGKTQVEKGLAFLHANVEKLLEENYGRCPRWFVIVFPSLVELTRTVGQEILFPDISQGAMTEIFSQRQQILEIEDLVDKHHYPPLLSCLEALPPSFDINEEDIVKNLGDDGSLFQSPSATACAFMTTGNEKCLAHLQSLVQNCANGVPPTYPMDEDLIKLCIVNQLQKLGLAEHFIKEIEEVLARVYRNYKNEENAPTKPINSVATKLYKDSLAFQLLRMHGYSVSPWTFCWFLNNQEIQEQIENDPEYFSTVMLNVYKATDVMFPEEHELQEARSFAKKSLEKIISVGKIRGQNNSSFPSFQRVIEHELAFPWLTRLEHLEHRMWIEENDVNALWMGKTSPHRLWSFYNDKLMQLASQNYELRQSMYKIELEELKRWSKDWGLSDMGFGREKTTYCYFAAAAGTASTLPPFFDVRSIIAKGAIIVTVADDFFDEKGCLIELTNLTNAVKRWDNKGLKGHSKTIFDALDNHVKEVADKYLQLEEGSDITSYLKDIWYETFASWLTEAKRSKSGSIPSMDEYLETGMTSIAVHALVLTASCFVNPSVPKHKLRPAGYDIVTKLLMIMSRLLNDTQSYEKEEVDGKTNFVLLHMRENPGADIEDSIAYVRELLAAKEKEILEHTLMDGLSDLPKACRHLHLSCLKVFQMFFNNSNRYDSDTAMLHDIQKAFYLPPGVEITKPKSNSLLASHDPIYSGSKKKHQSTATACHFNWSSFKYHTRKSFVAQSLHLPLSRNGQKNMVVPPKFKLSFI